LVARSPLALARAIPALPAPMPGRLRDRLAADVAFGIGHAPHGARLAGIGDAGAFVGAIHAAHVHRLAADGARRRDFAHGAGRDGPQVFGALAVILRALAQALFVVHLRDARIFGDVLRVVRPLPRARMLARLHQARPAWCRTHDRSTARLSACANASRWLPSR